MLELKFFFGPRWVEAAPIINRGEDEEQFWYGVVAQFEYLVNFISRREHPEKDTLMDGSLHSSIASYIPISSSCHLSTWTKLAFFQRFSSFSACHGYR